MRADERKHRIDEAMNRALSASDLPLVMWLCGHLDPVETPATLPQHILLCLVQQFGASDLLEDTVRERRTADRSAERESGFLFLFLLIY